MPVTTAAVSTSTNGRNHGISTIDAAHIHFREKEGPLQTYRCFTCADTFQADTKLAVMEHFARHSLTHTRFHSPCLYCGGKVHKYTISSSSKRPQGDIPPQYYHDCSRWKRKVDR